MSNKKETKEINPLAEAMSEVAKRNEDGIVVKGGKKYTQVVTRVEVFRKFFGLDYGIITSVIPFGSGFAFKAVIEDKDGRAVGTGHAYSATLAKEKSIEKLETTAIGRALAACGLSGGEFCTVEELDTHEERYKEPEETPQRKWLKQAVKDLQGFTTHVEVSQWEAKNKNNFEALSQEQQTFIKGKIAEAYKGAIKEAAE